jgi:anti-sigma-K factor RskA
MTDADRALIGDYVLGLMEPADALAFEAAMAADAELARAVAKLSEQFTALDDTAEPEAVSGALWGRIEAQLATVPQDAKVVPLRPRAKPAGSPRPTWQLLPMAASVLVAAGVGYFAGWVNQPQPPAATAPIVIAILLSETDQSPGAIIEAYADDRVRVVPLEAFEVPEGRVLEMWTLPDPATGPVSLGRFDSPQSIVLSGPDLPLPSAGQLYEITLEPAPGSPTGRPTGPILVKGLAQVPPG